MKKYIFVLICCLFSFSFYGQQEVFFTQANDFYNNGNYSKSIELYEKIVSNGNHSSELYFNLANAYYKSNEVASSVFYYEKALSLAPGDKEILNNYAFAKQTRLDTIEVLPKGVLTRFYEYLMVIDTDLWAILSIVGVVCLVVGFILFYTNNQTNRRRLFFGTWIIGAIVAIVALILAFSSSTYQKNQNYGIVFAAEQDVQSEPNLRSEKLFKVHEGLKVRLLENVNDWVKIELLDGKKGWIPFKELKEL